MKTEKSDKEPGFMEFHEFNAMLSLSRDEIWHEILAQSRETVKVKKSHVAVKNLEKIFDATLTLSHEKGFQAMTMRDLGRQSGLSMGALYSYFTSKDELLGMIQDQGRRIVVRVMTDQVARAEEPLAKLRQAICAHLYLSEVYAKWFYFAYMEAKNLSKFQQLKSIGSELFTEKIFQDILEEGMQKGVFQSVDQQLTAAAIKALLQDWYLKRWKYSRRKISVERYARFILEILGPFLGMVCECKQQ